MFGHVFLGGVHITMFFWLPLEGAGLYHHVEILCRYHHIPQFAHCRYQPCRCFSSHGLLLIRPSLWVSIGSNYG